MPKFYVTYACGGNLAGCYSVIDAETYLAARAIASTATRNKYAFMYDEKGFAGQVEEYKLTEVPLQAQSFASCEERD